MCFIVIRGPLPLQCLGRRPDRRFSSSRLKTFVQLVSNGHGSMRGIAFQSAPLLLRHRTKLVEALDEMFNQCVPRELRPSELRAHADVDFTTRSYSGNQCCTLRVGFHAQPGNLATKRE